MQMIERVAQAIAWEDLTDESKAMAIENGALPEDIVVTDEMRTYARAAIKAMREPTSEMLDAPAMKNWLWNDGNPVSDGELKDAWETMIDAALQEAADAQYK